MKKKKPLKEQKKKEQFLLKELQIPPTWIAQAKAVAYRYLRKPHSEFRFLIESKQWNIAHRLMMKGILKTRILIEQQHEVLRKDFLMLEQHSSEIQHWETNGATVLRYVNMFLRINKIRDVENQFRAFMAESHASGQPNLGKKAQLERASQHLGVEMEVSLEKELLIFRAEKLVFQLQTLKTDINNLDRWPSDFVHDQIVDNVAHDQMISRLDTTIASFKKKSNLDDFRDLPKKNRSPMRYLPNQNDIGMNTNPMTWVDPHHRLRALTSSTIHRLQEINDLEN